MASGSYVATTTKRVAVNPQAELPSRPPEVGPLAIWLQKVTLILRREFSRFGMAINASSLSTDRDRLRARFIARL